MKAQYPAGEYRMYVDTGFPIAAHETLIEVPDYFDLTEDKWAQLSDDEKEKMLYDASREFMFDEISYGCHLVDK